MARDQTRRPVTDEELAEARKAMREQNEKIREHLRERGVELGDDSEE
jgi:hypothetical protein